MKMMKTINRNWLISLALIVCYLTMSPVKAQEVNVSADVVFNNESCKGTRSKCFC